MNETKGTESNQTNIRVEVKFDLKDWISGCPFITEHKLNRKPRIISWPNRKSRVFNWKTLLNEIGHGKIGIQSQTHLLITIISGRNSKLDWFQQKTYWFIDGANDLTPVWISLLNGTSSAKYFTRFLKKHTYNYKIWEQTHCNLKFTQKRPERKFLGSIVLLQK